MNLRVTNNEWLQICETSFFTIIYIRVTNKEWLQIYETHCEHRVS